MAGGVGNQMRETFHTDRIAIMHVSRDRFGKG
jgi:hypothetical protein